MMRVKSNRIISALLAVGVIFTSYFSVAPASAKSETEQDNEGSYTSAVKTMVALGFLKSMNTDDENAAVTKGMFTAAVVDLMDYGEYSYDDAPQFADVTRSDPFYKEISIAAKCGIVQGDDQNKFEPDSLITYTTAVVILENAMGYYTEVSQSGGYPDGYIKTAASIGLSKGLKMQSSGRLNVGMCAKLLLNAGDAKVININLDSYKGKVEKGDKLFWERHRIAKDHGIVRANENTAIDSSASAGKNGIIIGDRRAYIYFSNDSTEYLGYNVDYYYRSDESDDIILYMEPKNTEITEINGIDIESFENQVLTYDIGSRRKRETIGKDVSVIFNGVYTINYFFEDGTSIFSPLYGDLKLIDNNNDGKTDIVSVIAYKNIVVSAIDTEECIVYDKYSPANNLDYSDDRDTWIITDSSGNLMSFADLKKWDVVSVAKSRNNDVLRAVMTRNTFTGTVNMIGEEDNQKTISTEKGKFYVTNAYSGSQGLPQLGTTATFYLDYYNNIAGIDYSGGNDQFGFLIKSYYDEKLDRCVARMMNMDGVVENVPFASKVRIDGDTFGDSALRAVLGAADSGEVDQAPQQYKFCVMAYKTDKNGDVNYVDTVKKGDKEDKNTLFKVNNYNGTYLWFATSRLFGRGGNSVCVGADSVIFKTPEETDPGAMKDYGLGSAAEFIYGTNYTVNAYSTNPDSAIPEVLHMPLKSDDASSMPRNARTCLVTDVRETINDENSTVYEIDYYSLDRAYTSYTDEETDASGLKPGDIIKVTFNAHNEISYINHVYSVDTQSFTPENAYGTHTDDFGNEYQPYDVKLFILDNDIVGIANEVNANTKLSDCTFQRITDKDTSIYMVKRGRKKNEVTKVTTDSLPSVTDYYHNGKATSLYLMTTYGVSKFLVIYKLDD